MQSPYEVVDLDGYFTSPEDAPARILVVLRAYFDESGHEGKNWMFLAGFIGSEDQWKEFVPKWKLALGLQRRFLHMTTLRWKKDSTRGYLERLGKIPYECGLEGCMAGVRYGDYEDLIVGTDDEKILRGWIACLVPMVIQILRGTPVNERIEFVFEQQKQYEPYADMMMRVLATSPLHPSGVDDSYRFTPDGKPRIAKWGFVPKASTLMTDPADYLAFALRETWTNRKGQKAQLCKPILVDDKGESREGYGSIMKRDAVRRTINGAQNLFIWGQIQEMVRESRLGR